MLVISRSCECFASSGNIVACSDLDVFHDKKLVSAQIFVNHSIPLHSVA